MATVYRDSQFELFRVACGFDMSSNTELVLHFKAPSGTEKTRTTSQRVALGTVAVTDSNLGSLSANQYINYRTDSGDFDELGTWSVWAEYQDSSTSPGTVRLGSCATFTVADPC